MNKWAVVVCYSLSGAEVYPYPLTVELPEGWEIYDTFPTMQEANIAASDFKLSLDPEALGSIH